MGWALRRKGLSMAEKMVLVVLADRSEDGVGKSIYSHETIGKFASCSRRTVLSALAGLEEKRLIHREKRDRPDGGRTSDLVHLLAPGCCADFAQGAVQDLHTIPY